MRVRGLLLIGLTLDVDPGEPYLFEEPWPEFVLHALENGLTPEQIEEVRRGLLAGGAVDALDDATGFGVRFTRVDEAPPIPPRPCEVMRLH